MGLPAAMAVRLCLSLVRPLVLRSGFRAQGEPMGRIGLRIRTLAAVTLLISCAWMAAAQTGKPYTLQVQSRVVLTDVTVTDRHGNPVPGIPQSDFMILDNGRPQKIASFEEHRQPAQERPAAATPAAPGVFSNAYLADPPAVVNVILIDATTIDVVDQMYLYEQMQHFVEKLPAGDVTAVFDRRGDTAIELQDFTSDHDKLLTAIRKAIPYPKRPGAWMASEYDTLIQMGTYLAQMPGRKNLLWFTGGSNLYLTPDPADAAIAASMQPIYDMLEAERIALYPIDARGLTVGFSMAMGAQQMLMEQQAQATGGHAFYNTNGLALAAERVLDTDGSYYTLTYSPDDLRGNGKWHKVRIRLRGGDYQLSYRRGYFDDGGSGAPNSPGAAPGQKPPMRTVLRADGTKVQVPEDRGIPIVFQAQALPAADPSAAPANPGKPPGRGESAYVVRYKVPATEIYPHSVEGNQGKDLLGSGILVFDRYGERIERRLDQVALHVNQEAEKNLAHPLVEFDTSVNLPWGDDYLLVAVWDQTSGRMGMLSLEVNVPKPGKTENRQ